MALQQPFRAPAQAGTDYLVQKYDNMPIDKYRRSRQLMNYINRNLVSGAVKAAGPQQMLCRRTNKIVKKK